MATFLALVAAILLLAPVSLAPANLMDIFSRGIALDAEFASSFSRRRGIDSSDSLLGAWNQILVVTCALPVLLSDPKSASHHLRLLQVDGKKMVCAHLVLST